MANTTHQLPEEGYAPSAGTLVQFRRSHFTVVRLSEPQPTQELLDTHPAWQDETRRPMFLLIAAVKIALPLDGACLTKTLTRLLHCVDSTAWTGSM